MNARALTTFSALIVTAASGSTAFADETEAQLAWQQPGYVMEVVVVTAPRPKISRGTDASADVPLARLEPGYAEEVVVVTASRREVMAAAAPRMLAMLGRRPFMGIPRE